MSLERAQDGGAVAHLVLRLVDGELRDAERERVLQRDSLGERHSFLFEHVGGDRAVDQAEPLGFARVYPVAGEQVFLRLAGSYLPRQAGELDVRASPADGSVREARVLRRHDEVAGGGEYQPAHDAVALHLRDGGLGKVAPAQGGGDMLIPPARVCAGDAVGIRPAFAVGELLRAAEIVSRREMLPRARHDHHADGFIVRRARQRRVELLQHNPTLRVADFRAVDRDFQNGVRLANQQGFAIHWAVPYILLARRH